MWQQTQYGEGDADTEYPDLAKVLCYEGTNASMLTNPNGTSYRRAIDSNFVQANGCTDPCNLINIPSIFRNQNELVLMKHSQALLWNFTIPGPKYMHQEREMAVENHLFSLNYWSLPFIVLQGFITAFFGRRDPREIRDSIYITLFMERTTSDRRWLRNTHDVMVRLLAGFNYLVTCAVVLVCVPLFVISIIGQELQLWNNQPDSEYPYQIGQWSSWVYTALVVLAALIARFHDAVVCSIAKSCRRCGHSIVSCFSKRRKTQDHESIPEHGIPSMAEEKRHSTSTSFHTKTDTPPSIRETATLTPKGTSASHATKPDPTKRSITATISHIYKESCHPLNQTGNGPIDEMRNFYRWCKNPMEVSRLVVRHPIRHRDTKFIDAPPAIVDAGKYDPRAQDQRASFFRGASVEQQR